MMAQLDQFLSLIADGRATGVILREGNAALAEMPGGARAVTKSPLTAEQIHSLVAEIAPPDAAARLRSNQPVAFEYSTNGNVFRVSAEAGAGGWNATIRTTASPAPASGAPKAAISTPTGNAAAMPPPIEPGSDHEKLDSLLRHLVSTGSSDLHLRCGEPPVVRLDGEMQRVDEMGVIEDASLRRMLFSLMPDRNRKEFDQSHDTDFAYEIPGVSRFRVNVMLERKGIAAVFRAVPSAVVSVEQMGISPEVQQICFLTKGLVLVTGPTGSGKSTTLCALIDLVNRARSDHVITIEDPIEFVHPNKRCIITQRQVGLHTMSFRNALRAALREDPDIVLVGELRDLETVAIAIETAETGHLVFGTLHTTTAASTVDRIIDQFPADRQDQIRVMLSDSLKGVISQTLCKKIGGGRVAAREILLATPAISNLIRESKVFQINSVLQTSRRLGMVTMNDALIELVDKRMVDPKEAYMKAVDKTGFAAMLAQRGLSGVFLEGAEIAAASPPVPPPRPATPRPASRR